MLGTKLRYLLYFLSICLSFFQKSPSAYLAEMALSTQERLNQTYEMRIPEITELLDMSEMTLQKVFLVQVLISFSALVKV